MESPAQNSRQGGIPKADPQGTDRGQETPKRELRPLAEDPAKRHPSQEGDLHGGAAGHKTAPQGRGSWSWGLGVSPSPRTHQGAGAGPSVQEPRGPASSQDPDLVAPQVPHAGEGPRWCPAGSRAFSQKCCPVQHHRAPPEEKSLTRVRTEEARRCTGTAPGPGCARSTQRTGRVNSAQAPRPSQRPCKRPFFSKTRGRSCPRAAVAARDSAGRALLARRALLRAAEKPLLCARCGKRFGSNQQQQTAGGPLICPQCGQASGAGPSAPEPPAQRLCACDQGGKALTRPSSPPQRQRIRTGERPCGAGSAAAPSASAPNPRSVGPRHVLTHLRGPPSRLSSS